MGASDLAGNAANPALVRGAFNQSRRIASEEVPLVSHSDGYST
jgi:hypothetical protein